MKETLHKKVFYILLFLLPINLGKHFVFAWSYVDGLLIDYLIPTIFVQDVLVFTLLCLWLWDAVSKKRSVVFPVGSRSFQLLVFFVFSVFLSVLSALRFDPAIYAFIRLLLYVLFSLYVLIEVDITRDFPKMVSVLSVSVILLSLLGLAQWIKQASVFSNYLFFGEQPYTSATSGIAIKNFFDIAKVPAYGTFRHPNIFAGFLSVVLIWFLKKKSALAKIAFFVGVLALLVTLGKVALVAFLFGLAAVYVPRTFKPLLLGICGFVVLSGLLFATFPQIFTSDFFTKNPSVYRRANFIVSSVEAIKRRPLFGVGLNNNTVLIEHFLPPARDLRFAQPVHNIFMLTFAESGVFAFAFLLGLLILLARVSGKERFFLTVSLMQLAILGSFDHYVFTIHQTQLLFWIVVGLLLRAKKDIDTT